MRNKETNPIIKLCQKGMKMETKMKPKIAHTLYMQAWNDSSNSYESCIAAHFVARQQSRLEDTLHWNKESLRLANEVKDGRIKSFYPSLYFCVGITYENLNDFSNAKKYIDLAYKKVGILGNDDYGKGLKKNLNNARNRIIEKV